MVEPMGLVALALVAAVVGAAAAALVAVAFAGYERRDAQTVVGALPAAVQATRDTLAAALALVGASLLWSVVAAPLGVVAAGRGAVGALRAASWLLAVPAALYVGGGALALAATPAIEDADLAGAALYGGTLAVVAGVLAAAQGACGVVLSYRPL